MTVPGERGVLAVVVARNEEPTIAGVVKSLRRLGGVAEVTVIDGGSSDRTVEEATGAGARVLMSARPVGKGDALEGAFDRLPEVDILVLADGDVGETAEEAELLMGPVLRGELDIAIGRLPGQPGGGFGLVKGMARWSIRVLTGFDPREPLSGQRCATREVLRACRPFARGFGLETAMTIDAARLGYRVGEIPVAMTHRPTGRSVSGFAHRARQGLDIIRAVFPRALSLR